MTDTFKKIFIGITKKQCTEFGLVTILAASFLAIYLRQNHFILYAFFLTLVTLIIPIVFYPFAAIWFWLSGVLSAIGSRVLLTMVFFIVVTPVGVVRRILNKDNLKTDQFKKSKKSVMIERDHLYTEGDFTNTF
jgi:uncharacterized membrane protein